MRTPPQVSIEQTLTRAEFTTPFALGDGDDSRIPRRTRLALVWDGPDWTEIDPITGLAVVEESSP